MIRRTARVGLTLSFLAVATTLSRAQPPVLDEARLKQHVVTLSSPEYEGRRGAGGEKAADYIVREFREMGLAPLFGDGQFFQTIPGQGGKGAIGRNVGGLLRGSGPTLRDEWVIVSAHFDHLGTRGGQYYPGADDNASGVAMMLELARSFAKSGERPKRSLMFIGFDLEEIGLFGSRYFVEHSPIPIAKVALFVTADMIGRSLGGVCEPYVFVMGTEHAPALRPWLESAARGGTIKVGLLGSDLLLLNRSDYGPFRNKKVPYLFFTTGENPVYHTTKDTADTLNYAKLTAISRIIQSVVRQAGSSDRMPEWSKAPDNPLDEAVALRDVIRTLLGHREDLKIGGPQAFLMGNALRTLDGIVKRGAMTPEERTGVMSVVRIIMASVF